MLQQHAESNALITQKREEVGFYQQVSRSRGRNPGAVFGAGYQGYGNGITDGNVRVLYPCQRKRPGGRKARELRLTRAQLQSQAEQADVLVPVRLDVDYDKIKLRDTFTWNLHDRTVPLELFVEQLVEDFHLPLHAQLLQQVTASIREQVTGFHPHVFLADEPLDPALPYTAYKNDDMRVLIKLNITIGQHTLMDQFEWDLNNPLNSPEEFAQLLTREFSLSGEFTTAIAHSIREQCQLFTKALFVTSHPFDGRPIEDEDVRSAMLQSPLTSIFRPHAHQKDFTPLLYELSENELERAEKSQSREARRLKRVGRRGGPTIPDLKDMPKTHRTQIVSSTLPGAVQKLSELEKSMVVKPVKDGDSDDDESESDVEDLPPEKTIPGYNNMTRRQKLAAINAQKANAAAARSQTPEVHSMRSERSERYQERQRHDTPIKSQLAQPPVTMTPAQPVIKLPRRDGVPLHQDSGLLTLKLPRAKLQKKVDDMQRRDALAQIKRQQQMQQQAEMQKRMAAAAAAQQQQAQSAAAASSPPATSAASPSPSAASPPPASSPVQTTTPAPAPPPTAAAAAPPPAPTTATPDRSSPPPAPAWLQSALQQLRDSYPSDNFEELMRWTAFDAATDSVIPQAQLAALTAQGKRMDWRWSARIRCHDCPGKLYTPGPQLTCENFLMHLKNRGHRFVAPWTDPFCFIFGG
ncbi:hypothetical protein EDC01DRAFT_718571 [Geopyxis carbonaria]|nr:hypothetical protein EDC01DRAFT_718571 [Geopyxis carbonaria]